MLVLGQEKRLGVFCSSLAEVLASGAEKAYSPSGKRLKNLLEEGLVLELKVAMLFVFVRSALLVSEVHVWYAGARKGLIMDVWKTEGSYTHAERLL